MPDRRLQPPEVPNHLLAQPADAVGVIPNGRRWVRTFPLGVRWGRSGVGRNRAVECQCSECVLMPVATENRIRAGADAAMGYPHFGMIDLLKLLGGLLVGVFRSHAAREAETAFLRHQLVVLRRSAPARLRLRAADRLIFVWLYGCSLPCSKPRLSSSLRRWCAGIGAASVYTGVGNRAVVSAGLRSRPTSAI